MLLKTVVSSMALPRYLLAGLLTLIASAVLYHHYGHVFRPTLGLPAQLAIVACAAGASWVVGQAWRRQRWQAQQPFARGLYLIGTTLVDARRLTECGYLRMHFIDTILCRKIVTEHHTNGRYTHTSLTFDNGQQTWSFAISRRAQVDVVLDLLRALQQQQAAATAAGDLRALRRCHPCLELINHTGSADDWDVPPFATKFQTWRHLPLVTLAVAALAYGGT